MMSASIRSWVLRVVLVQTCKILILIILLLKHMRKEKNRMLNDSSVLLKMKEKKRVKTQKGSRKKYLQHSQNQGLELRLSVKKLIESLQDLIRESTK